MIACDLGHTIILSSPPRLPLDQVDQRCLMDSRPTLCNQTCGRVFSVRYPKLVLLSEGAKRADRNVGFHPSPGLTKPTALPPDR